MTSIARTVVDLARSEDAAWALAAADAALHRGVDIDELHSLLEDNPRRPGNRAARQRLLMADGRAESPGESISRFNMAMAGLPEPVLQQEFTLPGGSLVRTDFWWPQFRLVGEFDGLVKYGEEFAAGGVDALVREKAREDGLRGLGLFVVRWGWRVALNRQLLAATIRGAMGTALRAA